MYANPIILRDLTLPLSARKAKHAGPCGPYMWGPLPSPPKHAEGWGGYLDKWETPDKMGCSFRLRIERAQRILQASNNHYRDARTTGYYGNPEECTDTWIPYVLRLNHGRGFLAATGLGAEMCFSVEPYIYEDAEQAACAAYRLAEKTAEEDAEFQAKGREELEEEERLAAFAEAEELPEDMREN